MWRYIKSGLETACTLLICAAAIAIVWQVTHPISTPRRASALPKVERVTGLTIASADISNVRGTGRVALVEFADYECPYCAKHMKETGPMINEKMIDSGRIRHVFFNFPLAIHRHAPKASEAAECAGKQGRFWEMSESLFGNPEKLDVADLVARSETIGIDPALFRACLDSGETADKIRRDVDEGRRVGVISTPTFFFGSVKGDGSIELVTRLNGALAFEEFEKAVRTLLPDPRQARR